MHVTNIDHQVCSSVESDLLQPTVTSELTYFIYKKICLDSATLSGLYYKACEVVDTEPKYTRMSEMLIHHPCTAVYQNAAIFEFILAFDHIFLPREFHHDILNG